MCKPVCKPELTMKATVNVLCYKSKTVVESIVGAKTLHKELIRKAHPDRHSDKEELAKEITDLVNENRYNYRELLKLKERIKEELLTN